MKLESELLASLDLLRLPNDDDLLSDDELLSLELLTDDERELLADDERELLADDERELLADDERELLADDDLLSLTLLLDLLLP